MERGPWGWSEGRNSGDGARAEIVGMERGPWGWSEGRNSRDKTRAVGMERGPK